MSRVTGQIRKAIEDYQMIQTDDKICVGVSGGKDSLVLLCALAELRRYYPRPFDLLAVTLDMGYENADYSAIRALCNRLGVPYIVRETQIKQIVFDIRNETNPCALCANLRRGALHNAALEAGFDKVALGHHYDDVVETFLLSLLYEGRISCFSPVTFLDRKRITLIRPMLYVPEYAVATEAKKKALPILHNPCPADGNTKRQEVKKLLHTLELQNRGVKQKLFTALQKSAIDGWAPVSSPQ